MLAIACVLFCFVPVCQLAEDATLAKSGEKSKKGVSRKAARGLYSKRVGFKDPVTDLKKADEPAFSNSLLARHRGAWCVRNRFGRYVKIVAQGRSRRRVSWLYGRTEDGVWHTFRYPPLSFRTDLSEMPLQCDVLGELRRNKTTKVQDLILLSDKKLFLFDKEWYITKKSGRLEKVVSKGGDGGLNNGLLHGIAEDGTWHTFEKPCKSFKQYLSRLPLKLATRLSYDGRYYLSRGRDGVWEKLIREGVAINSSKVWALTERGKWRIFSDTPLLRQIKRYLSGLPKVVANNDNHLLIKMANGVWAVRRKGRTRRVAYRGHRFVRLRAADGRWVMLRDIPPESQHFVDSLPHLTTDIYNMFTDDEPNATCLEPFEEYWRRHAMRRTANLTLRLGLRANTSSTTLSPR